MTDLVSNAEYRAALGSIKYNASNFQVFTFWIATLMLAGFAVLAGSLVAIQAETDMSSQVLTSVIAADAVFLVILALTYLSYLRNIGRYVSGRIKSSFATPEMRAKCVKRVGRYSTGTSPRELTAANALTGLTPEQAIASLVQSA